MVRFKNIYRWTFLLLPVCVLFSCKHDEVEYRSFNQVGFHPYKVEITDLDEGFPEVPSIACAADLVTESDSDKVPSPRRTTSIAGTPLAKEVLSATNTHKIHSISGTYISHDQYGKKIVLSGKVMLPATGKIKNIILISHYTIGAAYEAPSECFQLEGILATMGFALIFPDYIGFGVSSDRVHPYLCAHLTAHNVVDMLEAVVPYLDSIGRSPVSDEIYLMGYSQGGATTVAVQRLLETDPVYLSKYKVRRNFAGAGPYDIAATYDEAVANDYLGIPCAIPMIIQGMNEGERLNLRYDEFFTDNLLNNFEEWINSKKYTVVEIAKLMGVNRLSEFMTEEARQKRSANTSVLYRAMLRNSIVADDGWLPQAPLYMFHSLDDDTVPFLNSQRAKDKFAYANVEYNFGHYGTHQMGCIRFIGCVKKLLESETDFVIY